MKFEEALNAMLSGSPVGRETDYNHVRVYLVKGSIDLPPETIEQDADAVLILHIPDPDDLTGGELRVAKARAGQRDKIHVQMLTHWATIAPALRAWDHLERNPS